MDRRNFIKFAAISGATTAFGNEMNSRQIMSVIDLDLCDGCKGENAPKCVMACKIKNATRFPEPQTPVMDY